MEGKRGQEKESPPPPSGVPAPGDQSNYLLGSGEKGWPGKREEGSLHPVLGMLPRLTWLHEVSSSLSPQRSPHSAFPDDLPVLGDRWGRRCSLLGTEPHVFHLWVAARLGSGSADQ